MQIIQISPIIVGMFFYNKYKLGSMTFYIMFIVSVCGLGFYYNDAFRVSFIFPSDIYLLVFVASMLFSYKSLCFERKTLIELVLICLFQFLLGLISNFEISEIFTDFKYVLYFFVPYFYGKLIWNDKEKNKSCFYTYIICIVITLILNWHNFFTNGIRLLISGGDIILRTFGIGMGFACGSLALSLIMFYRKQVINKYGMITVTLVAFLLVISAIVSFTRTMWISFFSIIVLNYIFVIRENRLTKKEFLLRLYYFSLLLASMYFLYIFSKNNFPALTNAIIERFFSISEATTDTSNTLYARINSILSDIDVFYSPKIFIGYGLGALYQNRFGIYYNRLENSYIYYLWKYGLIVGLYLFYRVYNKLKRLWESKAKINRIVAIYIFVTLIIGSMSGNYNETYQLCIISFIFSMNFSLIFPE